MTQVSLFRSLGVGAWLVSSLVVGCSGPQRGDAYVRAVAEARRGEHDGHFALAAQRFDEAARTAKVPRDVTYARYEAAVARARAGDVARAAEELRAIATSKPANAYSAQAAFKAAELARVNDEAAGIREHEAMLLAFPHSGVAQAALVHVLRRDDDNGGPSVAQAHLERLLPKLAGTHLEEMASYERARRIEAQAEWPQARDAYLEVARKWPYPFGPHNDDALFHAAAMAEKMGLPRDAIDILERLVAQREVSDFIGTYERPKYLPAMLRIAEIQETKLHARSAARETFHRIYSDFKTSVMRDDALWREAELWRKDNDEKTACARLTTLAHDFPDSRYVPCASERCPNVTRPAKSKAPTTCHAYLVRPEAEKAADEASPATLN